MPAETTADETPVLSSVAAWSVLTKMKLYGKDHRTYGDQTRAQ